VISSRIVDEACSGVQQDAPESTRGFVQTIRNGVGWFTGRGETPAANEDSTLSQVGSGLVGVLRGEQERVSPEASVVSSARSWDADNLPYERSWDADNLPYESDFDEESETEHEAAGAAERLYTEDDLNRLNGPELVQLRMKHKKKGHCGTAKQHATTNDIKHDLMQLTTNHALN
jgi:hypothetical protein